MIDGSFTLPFDEIKEHIRNNPQPGFKIITEGDTYITVEDSEGHRAYMQAEKVGKKYLRSYTFYTEHKQHRHMGAGRLVSEELPTLTLEQIVDMLQQTCNASKAAVAQFYRGSYSV